jgi:hypothetical protein
MLRILCIAFIASPIHADDDAFPSFYDKIGQPLKIAYLNPVDGFRSLVFEHDKNKNMISDGWFGIHEADVIVTFLAYEDEIEIMPELVQDVYNIRSEHDKVNPFIRIDAKLSIGREVLFQFFVMDQYSANPRDAICSLAIFFYANLSGTSQSKAIQEKNSCR